MCTEGREARTVLKADRSYPRVVRRTPAGQRPARAKSSFGGRVESAHGITLARGRVRSKGHISSWSRESGPACSISDQPVCSSLPKNLTVFYGARRGAPKAHLSVTWSGRRSHLRPAAVRTSNFPFTVEQEMLQNAGSPRLAKRLVSRLKKSSRRRG